MVLLVRHATLGMKRAWRHRAAGWVNRWLPAYGWAIWFSQDQRLPDEYSVDAEPATYTLVPTGPIKMRLGRYPDSDEEMPMTVSREGQVAKPAGLGDAPDQEDV